MSLKTIYITCVRALPDERIIGNCYQSSLVNVNQLLSNPGIKSKCSCGFFDELKNNLRLEVDDLCSPYHIYLSVLIDSFVLLDYFELAFPSSQVYLFRKKCPTSMMACKICLLQRCRHPNRSMHRLLLSCCSYFYFLLALLESCSLDL